MSAIGTAGDNLVFIVGSPRSGTTWLQRLMGAHRAVVTTQETALIDGYCARLNSLWEEQLPTDREYWLRRRHRGLPAVVTADEFEDLVVGFARGIYDKVLNLKPGAAIVVDKNPGYSLRIELIRRMFPDSGVLHVIRDGREVAASLTAARQNWGKEWAPRRVRTAAAVWEEHVLAARRAAETGRYLEVRYEDLVRNTAGVLSDCLRFAGVTSSDGTCQTIVERFRAKQMAAGDDSLVWSGEVLRQLGDVPSEPAGFFGPGTSGWNHWTTRERLEFAATAGPLLEQLGYVSGSEWTGATWAQRRLDDTRTNAAARLTALGWRMHQALGRRGWYVHVSPIEPYE